MGKGKEVNERVREKSAVGMGGGTVCVEPPPQAVKEKARTNTEDTKDTEITAEEGERGMVRGAEARRRHNRCEHLRCEDIGREYSLGVVRSL